ncbi:MAG: hypothetical protein HQK53_00450 [Oligoflexia bacterium]|nr:hypothetical protein [Oligoflexia bacterium]
MKLKTTMTTERKTDYTSNLFPPLFLFTLLFPLATLISCSSDSSVDPGTSTTTATFSGTIANASSSVQLDSILNVDEMDEMFDQIPHPKSIATTVAGDILRCKTNDSNQTTYQGTIGTDGVYSLSIPKNVSVKCEALSSTDTTNIKGTFVISSSNNKSLNGGNQNLETFVPANNISAGTVIFDPYQAKLTMSDTTLGTAINTTAPSAPWDFTGTYVASTYTGTAPSGYSALCTVNESQNGQCDGPYEGMNLYIKRLSGYEVDSSGTTTTTPKYAIMVWQSRTAFESCGSKLGFTYADAKTNAKIDLTNSGVSEGDFTWTSSISPSSSIKDWSNVNTIIPSGAATISSGWKISTSMSGQTMQDCETVSIGSGANTIPGWKCTDSAGKTQTSLGGGCVNSSNSPVNVTEWSGLTCNSESLTGDLTGYTKDTCSGTTSQEGRVTCTSTSKRDNGFNWNNVTNLVSAGAPCSNISATTDKSRLIQLRCYSEAYWRYLETIRNSTSAENYCFRDLRTDWSATSPDDFIISSGPAKSSTEYVLEQFTYTSNTSGSFRNEETDSRGVQITSGGNSIWINCRILRVMNMVLTRTSQGPDVLLGEMTNESRLIDTKQGCWTSTARSTLGNLDSDGKSVSRTMITFTKQ